MSASRGHSWPGIWIGPQISSICICFTSAPCGCWGDTETYMEILLDVTMPRERQRAARMKACRMEAHRMEAYSMEVHRREAHSTEGHRMESHRVETQSVEGKTIMDDESYYGFPKQSPSKVSKSHLRGECDKDEWWKGWDHKSQEIQAKPKSHRSRRPLMATDLRQRGPSQVRKHEE